jgi:hypothetical protein
MQYMVMSRNGDDRQSFDMATAEGVDAAEKRFKELTGSGFRAAKMTSDGSPGTILKKFDATAEKVLFIPSLQGG